MTGRKRFCYFQVRPGNICWGLDGDQFPYFLLHAKSLNPEDRDRGVLVGDMIKRIRYFLDVENCAVRL